jgi:hypothetical protein
MRYEITGGHVMVEEDQIVGGQLIFEKIVERPLSYSRRRNSKLDIIRQLLVRKEGCLGRDLLKATGWKAINVHEQARLLDLKLRTSGHKQPVRYFGTKRA